MIILAADDEQLPLSALAEAISEACPDAELHTFRKPAELIAFAKEHRCDVAFLDIQMRGMTGLELARRLKELCPDAGVIFVTGYSEYALEAFALHARGYLMKPVTAKQIREELDELKHAPQRVSEKRARAQTFGNFEFFIDNEVVSFTRSRTKELLAYLVDRHGASCNTAELCAVLFEDGGDTRASRSLFRSLVADLAATLKRYGMQALLVRRRNSFCIDTSLLECDMYRFIKADADAVNAYRGEYMRQYSWAEMRSGQFESIGKS